MGDYPINWINNILEGDAKKIIRNTVFPNHFDFETQLVEFPFILDWNQQFHIQKSLIFSPLPHFPNAAGTSNVSIHFPMDERTVHTTDNIEYAKAA